MLNLVPNPAQTKPRVIRGIDYTFAGIFGAFAVKILATPGR